MAMFLKQRSFKNNLFVSIGGIFILFALCFGGYQYHREKRFKIDILHSRLQMYNYEMMQSLGSEKITERAPFMEYVQKHNLHGLRITIIDTTGRVLQESNSNAPDSLGNHLQRVEIAAALKSGSGYDLMRRSAYTNETYFYSATRFGNIIVRSAVPYSIELTESLTADNSYIYYAILLTLLLVLALYYNTSRVARHIGYLKEFARKAEEGQELDHELERQLPDDELGDISHTIISLYWKQQHSEREKNRIKRQLTQNMAHELKTPAYSIHGYLESILEHPDMDPERRQHFLERCYVQSERMSKLLVDMAALTKLDDMEEDAQTTGGLWRKRDQESPVNINSLIGEVLEDTDLQLQEKGIKVSTLLPDDILIYGDSSLLYSIFRNIIDNSIAYATGATEIKIECREAEDSSGKRVYHFAISDNGIGVDPKNMLHLFERFYRTDKGRSRKLGGTGLGLAIVKNAAAAHGGKAWAEPTPGGGLTIRFSLTKE